MKKTLVLLLTALLLCTLTVPVFAGDVEEYMSQAKEFEAEESWTAAGLAYRDAFSEYTDMNEFTDAVKAGVSSIIAFATQSRIAAESGDWSNVARLCRYVSEMCSNVEDYVNRNTGSTLSEGNLTIVLCVAGVAAGLVGGFLLGRRKKPAKGAEE